MRPEVIFYFCLITTLVVTPGNQQEVFTTVTSILYVGVNVVKALSQIWKDVIDNSSNVTVVVSNVTKSLGELREALLVRQMGDLFRAIEDVRDTQEAGIEALATIVKSLPDTIRLELRLNQLATFSAQIDVLNDQMKHYAREDGRGEFERYTLENFASNVVSHDSNSVWSLLGRISLLMFPNQNDKGIFWIMEKSLKLITEMEEHGVVPDVIDRVPPKVLEVIYANGIKVNMGNELTPTMVKDPPIVTWETEPNSFYLLCMTDPDAPSRNNPLFREWHHWLLGNIIGNDLVKTCLISEYIGAGPPQDTGLHRYIFLVYKQPKKLLFHEKQLTNKSGDGRGKFSIRNFATKYKLGNPIAGNFFQAQWDDYVPTLYEQLGM